MSKPLTLDEVPRALRYGESVPDPLLLVRGLVRDHCKALDTLLAEVACEHFELAQAWRDASGHLDGDTSNEWKAVEIILSRLGDLLARYDVTAADPAGAPWRDEMRADYDLVGFAKRDDVETPRIAHVQKPQILRRGRRLQKGAVTVDAPASRPIAQPPSGEPSE